MSADPEQGWVTIAVLGKTRGNRGELVAVTFGKPERLQSLKQVVLFAPGVAVGAPREVELIWRHGDRVIFKFVGVDSISDAERLRGCEVRIPLEERAEPEPGEFYISEVVGCQVVERVSGEALGRVTGFQETGGTPLLEVEGNLLIPFATAICVDVDLAAGRIVVDLPEGLKDLNR